MSEKQAERELFDLVARSSVRSECHDTRMALYDRKAAVSEAEHAGWLRGFKMRGEIADDAEKAREPMILLIGFGLGFLLAMTLALH